MALTVSVDEIVQRSGNPLLSIRPHWKRVRLREVATVLNGFAFKSSQFTKANGIPLIRIRDVGSDSTETNYVGEFEDRYLVEPGDLLIGMDGDFNCARWRGPRGLLNQRVCKITLDSGQYHPRFLDYALPGYLKAINDATSSVTVKHLSSRTVEDIPLPFPPVDEQEEVVAELEKQFSRLEEAVANLKRVKANLKRYKAAVLKAAVEGRLVPTEAELARREGLKFETGEQLLLRILERRRSLWKGKGEYADPSSPDTADLPPLPVGWAYASAEQLTDPNRTITYGVIKLGAPVDGGVPVLRSSDVRNLQIDLGSVKTIAPSIAAEYRRTFLQGGEVVVTVRGTLGGVAVAPAVCRDFNVSREVAMLAMVESEVAHAVAQFIAASPIQRWLMTRTKGIAYTGINIETLKALPVPVPPLQEQRRIRAETERQLSLVSELAIEIDANLLRSQRMRQATLHHQFGGAA
jgi:type I restriction enzyme S subunit